MRNFEEFGEEDYYFEEQVDYMGQIITPEQSMIHIFPNDMYNHLSVELGPDLFEEHLLIPEEVLALHSLGFLIKPHETITEGNKEWLLWKMTTNLDSEIEEFYLDLQG